MPFLSVPVRPASIETIIQHWASLSPQSPAIDAPGRKSLDYSNLLRLITDVRKRLRQFGIASDDRIAMILGQQPSSATAFLGVAACSTAAPLNPSLSRSEFTFYLQSLRPRALLIDSELESVGRQVASEMNIPILEVHSPTNGPSGEFQIVKTGHHWERLLEEPACQEQSSDIAVLLHTSGSTGQPKCVPLRQHGICISSWDTSQSLGLTNKDRCLNMLPPHHVHGLVSCILVAIASGGCLTVTPEFQAYRIKAWLKQTQPTWFSASPAMHHAIVDALEQEPDLPMTTSLRFVRTGSTPLQPTLLKRLRKTFDVPVVEAYGMTEVPHISGNPPDACRAGSVGKRVVAEWKIVDESGLSLPAGRIGEVVVRGPNVISGYEITPACHSKTCRPDSELENTSTFNDGWFHTGDLGRLDEDGYLFLAGRIKEVINRGGISVMPREVEEALLSHPAVQQAVAFGVEHPTLGEDVAAAVVAAEHDFDESEIRRFVASRLSDFKVPSRIVRVDEIPVENSGKVNRLALAKRLASRLKAEYEPPTGELEPYIATVFQEILRVDRVGRNDHFFFLGGDSLSATRATSRLCSKWSIDLSVRGIFESPTVAELAIAVLREMLSQVDPDATAGLLEQLESEE